MSTYNLVLRLSTVLRYEINRHTLNLSSCCMKRFRRFINSGVAQMELVNMTQNQMLVYLAENHIKYLVEHLTRKARGKGSYPNIGEITLENAIEECSPMWPYNLNGI